MCSDDISATSISCWEQRRPEALQTITYSGYDLVLELAEVSGQADFLEEVAYCRAVEQGKGSGAPAVFVCEATTLVGFAEWK